MLNILDVLVRAVGTAAVDGALLLQLIQVDVGHGRVLAVDDLGQLLERGAARLDVHEVDEAELEEDPALWKRPSACLVATTSRGEGWIESDLPCR